MANALRVGDHLLERLGVSASRASVSAELAQYESNLRADRTAAGA